MCVLQHSFVARHRSFSDFNWPRWFHRRFALIRRKTYSSDVIQRVLFVVIGAFASRLKRYELFTPP